MKDGQSRKRSRFHRPLEQRQGEGGTTPQKFLLGVVGSLSLDEKEARKAEELFTIILRPEKARQLTEIQTTY